MNRAAKIALALLGAFAVLILVTAVPDWSDPNDLNSPTGPENAGRFFMLVGALPVVALFALAIVVARGRYRQWVLNTLYGGTAFIALYVAAALVFWPMR